MHCQASYPVPVTGFVLLVVFVEIGDMLHATDLYHEKYVSEDDSVLQIRRGNRDN